MLSYLYLVLALNHTDRSVVGRTESIRTVGVASGCGTRHYNRIDYATTRYDRSAEPDEFPWTVLMVNGNNEYAGALIHPRVVLTCNHRPTVGDKARAGIWSRQEDASVYQERAVERVIYHPQGKTSSGGDMNNVALVILKEPFVLGTRINTICLPEHNEDTERVPGCFASSFGKTRKGENSNRMKRVELTTLSREACTDVYRATSLGANFYMDNSIICAGNVEGVEACTFDGGSPLACPIHGEYERYQLAGIEGLWGYYGPEDKACTAKYYPVAFSYVSRNRQWIDVEMSRVGYDDRYYNKMKSF